MVLFYPFIDLIDLVKAFFLPNIVYNLFPIMYRILYWLYDLGMHPSPKNKNAIHPPTIPKT